MNRGHLIGYQFSGLNSEIKNLVPMTRYLNAGTMSLIVKRMLIIQTVCYTNEMHWPNG
ncbi:MAG: DNA/RNA non-specific endonuclease [Streptococcus salivarius]